MRKLLTSFLTLALASSVSTAAFATTADTNPITNDGSEDTSINVSAIYRDSSTDVISVDIAWDRMDFTYTAIGSWDPETHSVSSSGTGTWSWNGVADGKSTPAITVTNHSNIGVKAQFEFKSNVDGLTGSFSGLTDDALTLATAEKTTPADAPSGSASFSISGSGISENKSLGTITVNVTKNADDSGDSGDSGDSDGIIKISTGEGLYDALQNEEENQRIQLTSDITFNDELSIWGYYGGQGAVIDLNGHTINISDELAQAKDKNIIRILVFEDSPITFKNGTLHMERPILSGNNYANPCLNFSISNAIFEDCTFYGQNAAIVYCQESTVTFRNCTFDYDSINNGGVIIFNDFDSNSNLIFSGDTRFSRLRYVINNKGPSAPTITCLAGTYNFDPTEYVDTSNFTVTNDGNSIWTVTNK